MIEEFVADASMAIAWLHPAQATDDSAMWLSAVEGGAGLVVPAIWPLEVSNALLVLQRRRKLTTRERREALRLLDALPVTIDDEAAERAFGELAELAEQEVLSVYDAAYLDVALRRGLALACKDGPLRAAAERNGITLELE